MVDVDENEEPAKLAKISSTPTVLLFKGGIQVNAYSGVAAGAEQRLNGMILVSS